MTPCSNACPSALTSVVAWPELIAQRVAGGLKATSDERMLMHRLCAAQSIPHQILASSTAAASRICGRSSRRRSCFRAPAAESQRPRAALAPTAGARARVPSDRRVWASGGWATFRRANGACGSRRSCWGAGSAYDGVRRAHARDRSERVASRGAAAAVLAGLRVLSQSDHVSV